MMKFSSLKSSIFHQRLYTKLSTEANDDHDEAHLLKRSSSEGPQSSDDSELDSAYGLRKSRASFPKCLMWINGIFFCLSVFLFTKSLITYSRLAPYRERNFFLKQTSEPSPILDLLDIPLSTWRLNGTFVDDDSSIFRQAPSPEVDAAWRRVETQKPIPISRQAIIDQGRDPSDSAKFPESFGFGPDAYIGRIDVFHQIHCLNRIRMHLAWNIDYYYPPGDDNNRMTPYHRLHVSHCVSTLLQNLMCNGNVDVYGHFWADAQENAFPDFSMNHRCRDFEAILAWHDEHAVELKAFGAIRRPEGTKPRFMSHDFKEVFEFYDEIHPDDGIKGGENA